MRILLDECVDWRLLRDLQRYDVVRTVKQLGWVTSKDGSLLRRAAKEFDIFISVDKDLPFQQNISHLALAAIVLRPRTTRLADLRTLVDRLHVAIAAAVPGHFMVITWRDVT